MSGIVKNVSLDVFQTCLMFLQSFIKPIIAIFKKPQNQELKEGKTTGEKLSLIPFITETISLNIAKSHNRISNFSSLMLENSIVFV